jgi:formylglycine-generating enzyme required for sulfatase activity
MTQVFISYSHEDANEMEQLIQRLKHALPHITFWYESALSSQGKPKWWELVLYAVESSEVFLYLVSRDSLNSSYCRAELAEAKRLERPCIAVLLQSKLQIPQPSEFFQIIDLSKSKRKDERFDSLVSTILKALPQGERAKLIDFTQKNVKAKSKSGEGNLNRIIFYLGISILLITIGFTLSLAMVYSGIFSKSNNAAPVLQDADQSSDMPIAQDIEQSRDELGLRDADESSNEFALQRAEEGVFSNIQWEAFYPRGFRAEFNSVTMVLVPKGCFEMGNNADAYYFNDNGSLVQGLTSNAVHCFDTPFWIDLTEVTQAQFRAFGGNAANHSFFSGDNRPVEQITWHEAWAFCLSRNARLPTEEEWEYAARGVDGLIYPWGNEFLEENTVLRRNVQEGSADVGSIPAGASWVGALDMAGNVWEWTSSVYRLYPYRLNEAPDMSGIESQDFYSLRGGSWNSTNPHYLNMMTRLRGHLNGSGNVRGFRCAMDFDGAAPD